MTYQNMFTVCCERLEREQQKKPDMVESIADCLLQDHMELMAENKQLRLDAERYRWLRLCTSLTTGEIEAIANYAEAEFDAAIDAAMAKVTP